MRPLALFAYGSGNHGFYLDVLRDSVPTRFPCRTLSMTYALLFVAIVAEVIATSALKAAEGFTRLVPSLIVIVGYGVAFVCLSLTLKTIPVGIAYATWSGVGIVLVAGVGWALYGQSLDLAGAVGLGLIIAGVLIVNLVSKTAVH